MTTLLEPSPLNTMIRRNGPITALRLCAAGLCLLFLASCGNSRVPEPAPVTDEFSVMTYNLGRYNLDDRDGDGQQNDSKPLEERRAVIAIIAGERPGVLAVQEIGNPAIFEEFRYELQQAGLDYPHAEYLRRGQSELNLGLLSRYPIRRAEHHLDDRYSMGAAELPVLRGFLEADIEVNPEYTFRVIVAHLKSKVFHSLGQTEMRRNEARLLNKHVRRSLKEDPSINLLVVGDLNDNPQSAALREIMGGRREHLDDLRPADREGDAWTHFSESLDEYARIDYILTSPGMKPEYVPDKSSVVRHPLTRVASDHRPVRAVFRAKNRPAK